MIRRVLQIKLFKSVDTIHRHTTERLSSSSSPSLISFQLKHQAACGGVGCPTRHSHYARVRLWSHHPAHPMYEVCAVFTVLPHLSCAIARCAWRWLAMPSGDTRWAQLESGVRGHRSSLPDGPHRLIGALGSQSLVAVLTWCNLPLPTYVLAEENTVTVSPTGCISTIVRGRVLWHLGYTEHQSAVAFTQSYGEFQHAAFRARPIEFGAS